MNEIKKCSVSGVGFLFEKDAYNTLNNYLQSLKAAYHDNPDSGEILADIEARIAELILSAQSDVQNVVCLPLVENIIAQLGTPEAISGEEKHEEKSKTRIPRRLYRDLENSKLGGVCAGLAKYFGVEAVWLRLAMASPIILLIIGAPHLHWLSIIGGNLFGVFLMTYFILWFAIPSAKSARQKLEAEGEHISARSIADRQSTTQEEKAKSSVASFVSTLCRVAVIALKVFLGLMLFPLLASIFSLLIVIVGVITSSASLLSLPLDDYGSLAQVVGEFGAPMMVLAMLLILVPMLYVVYLFIVLLLNKRPRLWVLLSTFFLWIMMLVALCVTAVKYAENKSFDYFLDGGEIERIMKKDDGSLSRQIRDALDAEPTAEERAEWEKLLYDTNAKSIDEGR